MERTRYRRPESVLVVIHTEAGEVLLLRRVRPQDFWQSVTGSLEWSEETPAEAAWREVTEETGIEHAPGLVDWKTTQRFEPLPGWKGRFPPGTRENVEHLFSLALPGRCPVVLDPAEHHAFRWLDFRGAIETVWSWTNRSGLQTVGRHHGFL